MPSSGATVLCRYYAWNTSTGAPLAGDSANHTLQSVVNGVKGSNLSSPTITDLGSGWYNTSIATASTTLTQSIAGTSSTSNIVIAGIEYELETLPTATPGAAGGVFIAGTNAATTVTTSFTTTFTGNLTGSVGSVTGAVGSVTGAVGSVTGAVGSVTGNVGGISGITFPTNFSALGITGGGAISNVTLVGTLTTYTGNTPQTGDNYLLFTQANTELANAAAAPVGTATLQKMIQWLFERSRNASLTSNTSRITYKADGTTALGTATVSDNGTVTAIGAET